MPENYGRDSFVNQLRLVSKTLHRLNPQLRPDLREELKKIKLLGLFAGFGSIPSCEAGRR